MTFIGLIHTVHQQVAISHKSQLQQTDKIICDRAANHSTTPTPESPN
jgi:hypothetical protein